MDFFVSNLYADVLIEVLFYGKRRELVVLEQIGRRFHRLIDSELKKAPFILLHLKLNHLLVLWVFSTFLVFSLLAFQVKILGIY